MGNFFELKKTREVNFTNLDPFIPFNLEITYE